MKKTLKSWVLLLIAGGFYLFSWLVGGITGELLGTLGLICLALGIVRLLTEVFGKKKKDNKDK